MIVAPHTLEKHSDNSKKDFMNIDTVIYTIYQINLITHTETCIKSVNMFGWGIFGAVWKGTGGGQELSVEVIRAPGWGSENPPFSISLLALNILAFSCVPIGAFFRWNPSFPFYTKRFYVQKWGNFEPLYLSNESIFWE